MIFSFGFSSQPTTKEPNVSGQFYPKSADELRNQVQTFLDKVPDNQFDNLHVDVLIAPHAGYIFSGQVAAYGFKRLQHQNVKTAIILAPSHFVPFKGVSIWPKGKFKTPLGEVKVDSTLANEIISASEIASFDPKVFEREHSLEVMLPFLQVAVKNEVDIVPVIMGQPSFQEIQSFAYTLFEKIGARDDVVVIASTDLSHYHDDQTAKEMDWRALKHIEQFNFDQLWNDHVRKKVELCGFVPVMTSLFLANFYGPKAMQVLDYNHSGVVNGDLSRVVGYSSVVFSLNKSEDKRRVFPLNGKQQHDLLTVARQTIESSFDNQQIDLTKFNDVRLREKEGAFVSLYKDGKLRGCMGRIVSGDKLVETVRDTALLSAYEDPRFPKVTKEEWSEIEIEVSVLSKPQKISSLDEIELGKHGVILSKGYKKGVFLPQVATDTGWSKEKFLSELASQKAGLAADAWKDPQVTLEVFTAQVFGEKQINEQEN